MTTITALRPGLLVKLKTSVTGNVTYTHGAQKVAVVDGAEIAEWDTKRKIVDREEHEAAGKARSKARGLVRAVCAQSAEFGLLCPETAQPELEVALAEARKIANDFNATSRFSKIHVYALTGRIEPNDVEAVRAINSEVDELLADMERGVSGGDATVIREAASRAKSMAEMLSDQARVQAQVAVDAARRAANAISKAEKDKTAVTVDAKALRLIRETRKTFLDLDDAPQVSVSRPASAPTLDLEGAA